MSHEKASLRLGEALDLIQSLEGHCRDIRASGQAGIEAELAEIEAIISQMRTELNALIRDSY